MDPSRSHRLIRVINNCEGPLTIKYIYIYIFIKKVSSLPVLPCTLKSKLNPHLCYSGTQFYYTSPWIYSSYVSENISLIAPDMAAVVRSHSHIRAAPWWRVTELTSLSGRTTFTSFAKHREYGAGCLCVRLVVRCRCFIIYMILHDIGSIYIL